MAELESLNKKNVIHVLHVDDDPSILCISKNILELEGNFKVDNANSVEEAFRKISEQSYDAVISDYEMPKKDGLQFLKELREQKNGIPFVLFTGKGREEIAIEALNLGADGYHNKQGSPETVYGELAHRVKSVVAHNKSESALLESQLSTHSIIDSTIDMIWSVNCIDFGLVAFNQSLKTYFLKERGIAIEVGMRPEQLFPTEEFVEKWREFYKRALKEGSFLTEYTVYSGKRILQLTFNTIRNGSQVFGVSVFGKDITEKRHAEDACRESQIALEESQRIARLGTWILDIPTGIFETSDLTDEIFGIDKKYDHSMKGWASLIHPDDRVMMVDYLQNEVIGRRQPCDKEFRIVRFNDKEVCWLQALGKLEYDDKGHPIKLHGTSQDITERKCAQEVIRKSEEKYRQLVECSTDGIFTIDLSAKVYWANAYGMKLLGYSESDLPVSLLKVIPARYLLKTMKLFSDGLRGKVVTEPFDLEVYTKSRKRIPVSYRGTLLHDENGKVTGVLGIIRDFQEKKKMQKSLVDSQERFQELIETTGEFIWEMDSQWRYTYCSPQMEKIWGLKPEEMIGKTPFDVMSPEDREKTSEFFRVMGDSPKQFSELQTSAYDGKGGLIFVETNGTPFFDDKGKLLGFRGISRDITKRKKAEEKLRESEIILQNSSDSIIVADLQGKITSWNKGANDIFGYSAQEMLGESITRVVKPQERVEVAPTQLEAVREGKVFAQVWEGVRKDGSTVWLNLTTTLIKNSKDEPIGMVGFGKDITERKKAEEQQKVLERKVSDYSKNLKYLVDLRTAQLKDANERLIKSERLAAIGELAGMVGHDLRNPLTGIKNAAYYLKKKGTAISEAQAQEMFEIIDKSINRSDKIINDLLDYARELHLELTKYAARTLVDEALGVIQVPDRIQILNHVQEETLIWVNADKMMRVFINLIKNAIDAMPEKGILEISSCQTTDCVKIAFADTGTGISEETLQKLFSPLFTTKAQGMGFGLAICKRVIETHEGTITVKTAVNKGTTFTVTLPLKPKVDVNAKKRA